MRVIGDRSTNLGFRLKQQGGWKNWKGTVQCILQGSGTYNSRNVLPAVRCIWVNGCGRKGVSGCLLGLLPIRSTDEGTEKSEHGELLTN